MVIYLTLGFRHGSDVPVIIADQSTKPRDHVAIWKEARRRRWHPDFARIEMWSSNQGRIRWVRLAQKEPTISDRLTEPSPLIQESAEEPQEEIPASPTVTNPEPTKEHKGRRR